MVLNEPFVNVKPPQISASCKVHPPPTPLKTKVLVPTDLPPDVMVLPVDVDKKLALVQFVTVIPVANVNDPYILTVLLATANVGAFVTPVQSILATDIDPVKVTT